MSVTGIVLIHGAGLGSFIWKDLKPHLEAPSLAIDFPNRENTSNANKVLNLEDYHVHILKQIENWECKNIVVVAHSIGGIIGLKLAQQLGDRVSGFIAIGAAIPQKGNSFLNTLPFFKRILLSVLIKILGTEPPDFSIQQSYCNDLNQAQAEEVIRNYTAESPALYKDKCNASVPAENKMYIKLINDEEFSDELQEKMIVNLNPEQVIPLHSGHLPMMSCPKELAGIINEFVKERI